MEARTELVRVTIPLPRDLLDRLSVLAWRSDLTRPQLLRRYLTHAATEGVRRYADLEGVSPVDWYRAAYVCWAEDGRAAGDAGSQEPISVADRLQQAYDVEG